MPEDQQYMRTFSPLKDLLILLMNNIAATTPDAAVKQMLASSIATVIVGGQSHIQMLRRYIAGRNLSFEPV